MPGRPHQTNSNGKEQSWAPGTKGLAQSSSFPGGLVPLLLSWLTKVALRLHSMAEAPRVPPAKQQKGRANPRSPKDQGGGVSFQKLQKNLSPSLESRWLLNFTSTLEPATLPRGQMCRRL